MRTIEICRWNGCEHAANTKNAMSALTCDALDRIFAALADPTRRAILQALTEGEQTVSSLAAPFGLSQPTITSHIQKLEKAGLICKRPEHKHRYCKLNPEPLQYAELWLGNYQAFFEKSFDNLDRYLQELAEKDAET